MSEETLKRNVAIDDLKPVGDGRTLEVRIVPYNRVARVSDPPDFMPYDEMFVDGVFDRQLRAPNRVSVFVNVEHEQGVGGIVGRGNQLREVPGDGLHGTFEMLNHPDGDKALDLVKSGDLTGISLEFEPLRSVREAGVVKRVRARLINIALVRPSGSPGGIQAYKDAGVLAVRETSPAAEAPVVPMAVDLSRRLTALAVEPIGRMAVTRMPWNPSLDRFEDDQFERACLVDRGGDVPAKERCVLPVLEPNGDLNVNALQAAAAAIRSTPEAARGAAARKMVRYYRVANIDPPAGVTALART